MLRRGVSALALVLLVNGASSQSSRPPQTESPEVTFRAQTNLALVHFEWQKSKNETETGLAPADIQVLQNGIPQRIAFLQGGQFRANATPVDVHLLFDCSGSIQQASLLNPRQFKLSLLDEFPHVRVAIEGFSGRRLVTYTNPTRDSDRLNWAMDEAAKAPSGASPLYRSISIVARRATNAVDTMPLLIIVSDGLSFRDPATREDAIRAARSVGVPLFPVWLHEAGPSPAALRQTVPEYLRDRVDSMAYLKLAEQAGEQGRLFMSLAEATGGRAMEVAARPPAGLLKAILDWMGTGIRSEYIARDILPAIAPKRLSSALSRWRKRCGLLSKPPQFLFAPARNRTGIASLCVCCSTSPDSIWRQREAGGLARSNWRRGSRPNRPGKILPWTERESS